MEISESLTHRSHPTFKLEGVLYGSHDGLFTCWERIDTGEQVTDFNITDKLDRILLDSRR